MRGVPAGLPQVKVEDVGSDDLVVLVVPVLLADETHQRVVHLAGGSVRTITRTQVGTHITWRMKAHTDARRVMENKHSKRDCSMNYLQGEGSY